MVVNNVFAFHHVPPLFLAARIFGRYSARISETAERTRSSGGSFPSAFKRSISAAKSEGPNSCSVLSRFIFPFRAYSAGAVPPLSCDTVGGYKNCSRLQYAPIISRNTFSFHQCDRNNAGEEMPPS